MPTPKDQARVSAFCAWVNELRSRDEVGQWLKIHPRSLQRMMTGEKVPPVRLLDEAAGHAERWGLRDLATQLRDAAQPAEAANG